MTVPIVLSGRRERFSGRIDIPKASAFAAQPLGLFPEQSFAADDPATADCEVQFIGRSVLFFSPAGDLDGNGLGDLYLTSDLVPCRRTSSFGLYEAQPQLHVFLTQAGAGTSALR
jgi:hypothetical protein